MPSLAARVEPLPGSVSAGPQLSLISCGFSLLVDSSQRHLRLLLLSANSVLPDGGQNLPYAFGAVPREGCFPLDLVLETYVVSRMLLLFISRTIRKMGEN